MITFDFGYTNGTKAGQQIIANDLELNKEDSYQQNVMPFQHEYEGQRYALETAIDPVRYRNAHQQLDQAFELNPLLHRNDMQVANLEYDINPTRYATEQGKHKLAQAGSSLDLAVKQEEAQRFAENAQLRQQLADIYRQQEEIKAKVAAGNLDSGTYQALLATQNQLAIRAQQISNVINAYDTSAWFNQISNGNVGRAVTGSVANTVQGANTTNDTNRIAIANQDVTNQVNNAELGANMANLGTLKGQAVTKVSNDLYGAGTALAKQSLGNAQNANTLALEQQRFILNANQDRIDRIVGSLIQSPNNFQIAKPQFEAAYPGTQLRYTDKGYVVIDSNGNGWSLDTFMGVEKNNAIHESNVLAAKLETPDQLKTKAEQHAKLTEKAVDLVSKVVTGRGNDVSVQDVVNSLVGTLSAEVLAASGASANVTTDALVAASGASADKRLSTDDAIKLAQKLVNEFSPYRRAATQLMALPAPEYKLTSDGKVGYADSLNVKGDKK